MSGMFERKNLAKCKRICLRLKELRESKNVSLTEMHRKTNISKKHLEALEACNFKALPTGDIYHKNFIKRYLGALGVNASPYIRQLEEEEISFKKKKERTHPKKSIHSSRFGNVPAMVRIGTIVAILLVIAAYLGFQVKRIVDPPKLILVAPVNGLVSNETNIVVQGQTEEEARVSINGTEIMNNERGQFQESVDLAPGLNTITITAEKKHGKTTSETRFVVLKVDE